MQATNNILLIRPSNFVFNTETESSNAFQNNVSESSEALKQKVLTEFELFASVLKLNAVNAHIIDDTDFPIKPDAIFPNNWVSFHPNGTVILYPMFAPNRRNEKRLDIIEELKKTFVINNIVDFSKYEKENKFLEGTGSIVFDHNNKIAYACLSPRTDKDLFIKVCEHLQYKPIYFFAHDSFGKEIYHTNVMMCIAEKFAVICLESITDKKQKENVLSSLIKTGHQIIDITLEQMNNFAGNMLSIHSDDGKNIVVLSQSAYNILTIPQRKDLEKHSALLPLSINTIETIGGGSARCMMAEIFLPLK